MSASQANYTLLPCCPPLVGTLHTDCRIWSMTPSDFCLTMVSAFAFTAWGSSHIAIYKNCVSNSYLWSIYYTNIFHGKDEFDNIDFLQLTSLTWLWLCHWSLDVSIYGWCYCLGYLSRTEFPCNHITSLVSQANTGQGQARAPGLLGSTLSGVPTRVSRLSRLESPNKSPLRYHSHAPKKLSVTLRKGHWKEIWQCSILIFRFKSFIHGYRKYSLSMV